jgi:hypothetical protein
MSFLRHVGKNGDRKVAVVFREVPGEPHMCLVAYTETLNQHIHDPLIQCIDSDIGQNSENLADALNRTYTKDGRPILQVLHVEGQLKKVQTSLIMMTPAPNVKIRLSELNTMLDEMKQGEAAVKKMADLDNSLGIQDPADVVRRMRGDQNSAPIKAANGALDDSSIASNLRIQADKMVLEAKGLMAEADRIMKEAASLDPVLVESKTPVKKTKPTKTKTVA